MIRVDLKRHLSTAVLFALAASVSMITPAFALPPAMPTGLTVLDVPGDQGVALRLTWTANTEDDLKEYVVYRSTISFSEVLLTTVLAPGTTRQDGGLTSGTTYYYRITARNFTFEESGFSIEVSTVPTDNIAPAPPTGLTLSDVPADQGTALRLDWNANTEADIQKYDILKSTFTPFGSGFVARILAPGTTHEDAILSPGVTYYYHMHARDLAGNDSLISSPDVSAYPVDNFTPNVPTIFGASSPGSGSRLDLSWAANTEIDRKDYRVYRSTNSSVTQVSSHSLVFITAPIPGPGGTTHQDVGVVDGTTYYYRLSARDTFLNESGLSAQMSAFPTNTGAPGAPTGLVITDIAADQGKALSVVWTANPESDMKEYRVRRATFAGAGQAPPPVVIVNHPGTSVQDLGLSPGASYYYTVSAVDTGSFESGISTEVLGRPVDNVAPAVPTGLVVVDSPTDQGTALNINWGANTEPDLMGYGIFRATASPVDTSGGPLYTFLPSGTTHQDAGLSPNVTYYYSLGAADLSNNAQLAGLTEVSAYPIDSIAPGASSSMFASNPGTGNRLSLSWFAVGASDLKDYKVYRDTNSGVTQVSSHVVVTVGTTFYENSGLTNGTTYYYRVTARDTSFNEGGLSLTEPNAYPSDTGPPSTPINLNVQDVPADQGFQSRVFWAANVESDLKDYGVYRSTAFGQPATASTRQAYVLAPGTTFQDGGLSNGTSYYYKVTARDTLSNESTPTGDIVMTPSDNLAPAQPTGIAAADVPGDQGTALNVSWTANTEPDIKDYGLYRGTFSFASGGPGIDFIRILAPGTTHQAVGLSAQVTYYFSVTARDVSLNENGWSGQASAYTVDGIAPSVPAAATISDVFNDQGTRLDISWFSSTETDLKDYGVYRATASGVLGTKTVAARILAQGTTHRDLGLNPGVTYYYQLTSRDMSQNESGGSGETSRFPQDNLVPSGPIGVTAVNLGTGDQINLYWNSNTETDIKDYRIWRATTTPVGIGVAFGPAAVILAPGTSHQHTGLTNNTTYYYRVTARDSMNESALSAEASALTRDTTAPAPVDLTAATAASEVRLTFNAVGDDGYVGGPAASYQVRYATGNATPIDTEGEWTAAYSYAQAWVPKASGQPETQFLNGLTPGVTYYFAVKAVDGSGNIGTVGNSLSVIASPWEVVSTQGVGYSSGTLAWGDFDGDGDMDLAANGWTGSQWRFKIFRNDAGVFNIVTNISPGPGDGGVAWGDYDGDGDLDLAISGNDGGGYKLLIYRNDGGAFVPLPALWSSGANGGGVAWGDMDNDGDLDLVENYDEGPARIRIWRNDGGSFVAVSTVTPAPARFGSIALGDFDNDGDLDVVAQGDTGSGRALNIYRNDGGMTLASVQSLGGGLAEGGVAFGDYDNDGDLDLAVNGFDGGGYRFKVFRNDGGTFNQVQEPAGATGPGDGGVAWGDVDHDGDLDLIVNGFDGSAYKFQVYRNDSGTFNLFAEPGGAAGLGAGGVAVADYDDDGDLDLAVLGYDGSARRIEVYKSFISDRTGGGLTSNVRPANPTTYTPSGPPGAHFAGVAYSSAAGRVDLSWSGASDESFSGNSLGYVLALATSSIISGTATLQVQPMDKVPNILGPLRRKLPGGTTGLRVYGLTADTTYYWAVKSVDAGLRGGPFPGSDQTFDTAVSPNVITDLVAETAAQILLRWTAPGDDGTIGTVSGYRLRYRTDAVIDATNWPGSIDVSTSSWGTLKNPGQIERRMLVGLTPSATYYFAITAYDEKGNTATQSNSPAALAGEFSQNWFTNGSAPGGDTHDSTALGDLDGDGDLDLIAGKYIYRNDGGAVVPGPAMGAIISSPCVRIFDFNLDGKNDVAQSGWDGGAGRKARVFRNDGNDGAGMPIMVQFQDVLGGPTGLQWGGIAVADFDNDGDPDLAMTGTVDGTDAGARFIIFRNDRSPTAPFVQFQEPAGANQGFYRGDIEAADLDQDGDMDLIVSGLDNTGTRRLYTYRNNGSGSFALWQTLSVAGELGVSLSAIAVADYDNDGDIDVAVQGITATGGVRRVALFSNDGAGNLTQSQLMPEPIADGAIVFGDINQDGRTDFIVSGSSADGSKHTFVHLNDGGAAPYSTSYRLLGAGSGVGEGGGLALGEWTAGELQLFVAGMIDDGAGASGAVRQYQNNRIAKGLPSNTAPTAPSSFGVAYSSLTQMMTLQWSGASDGGTGPTPTNGLYYSVSVNTGSTGQVRVVAPSTATPLMGIQVRPKINSTTAGLILKGIPTDTTAYFAVASVDAGLKSSVFSAVQIGTWTYVQPNQITDLVAEQNAQAKLTWTAPGDDGTQGQAVSYLIRYSISGPISNEADWSTAPVVGNSMVVGGFPVPAATRTIQSIVISGLTPGVTTWFSVRAQDELGVPNQGSVSNSPAVRPTMFILGQEPMGPAGPGGNVAWGDYDGDGDMDLAVTGFDGTFPYFRIFRNDAGVLNFIQEPIFPGPRGGVAWGDYDRDGDLDLAVGGLDGSSYRLRIYRNDGGTFVIAQEPAGATGPGETVAWGDYDNDGDLDLAVNGYDGAGYRFRVYRNDGGTFNLAQEPAGATGPGLGSVAWGDYDNDGDLDLAVTGFDGTADRFRVYRNDSGVFVLPSGAQGEPAGATGPGQGGVAWGDYDNDGDLDLAVNGFDDVGYRFRVYRNDNGTFNLAQEPAGANVPGQGSVAWGDYDNDGDLDLAVNGYDGAGYRFRVYRNDGGIFNLDQEPAGVTGPGNGSVAWADFDNDGDLDLAVNGSDGVGNRFRIYKNVRVEQIGASAVNALPTNPTVFGYTYSHLGIAPLTLTWSGATDPEGAGNRLGYYLRLGTVTGQGTIISAEKPHDMPSSGISHRALSGGTTGVFVRGILPDTTYYWAVGTMDPGGRGIATAVEQMTTSFVAPIAVSNLLSQTTTNEGEIRLTWTAPGDDGTVGTATSYQIRLANVVISPSEAQWGVSRSATSYATVPAPLVSGTTQPITLTDLEPGVTFYFALKAIDDIGQSSTLSNSTYAPSQWLLPLTLTTFTAVAQATNIIKWDWVDRVGELNYQVMVGTMVAGESGASGVLPKNTTTWTEVGGTPNTAYYRHVDLTYEFNGLIHSTNVAVRRYTWASVPGVNASTGAVASSTTFVSLGWSGNGAWYQVQRSTTGVGSWNVALDSVAALTTTDAGLLPDTTYYYQILARNGDYVINPNVSAVISTRTWSAQPTALRVVAKSTGTITWAWTDNATTETGYFVLTTTIGGGGTDILVSSNVGLGAPGDSISKQPQVAWTEPGLNPNTQYTRRVRVVNGSTSSALGAVPYNAFPTDSIQIISSMTLPSTPIDLVATGVTQNSASISWNSGVGGAARYKIERATDNSGTPGTWATVIDWPDMLTAKAYTDGGLIANSAYWYRVAAFNSDQDSSTATNPPIRVTLGVNPPTAFAGTAVSTGSITWNWTDNSGNEESFRVRTATEGALVTLASNTVSWTEIGLAVNTSYTRHVSADTTLGHSDSNADTAWTWANAPGGPTFSGIAPNGVTVSWGAPTGGAGSYRLERSTVAGLASAVSVTVGASSGVQTGLSFGDNGVAANTTYYYRVLAYNGGGILNPNPGTSANVLTPPVSPTPGTPVVNSSSSVTWVWTNPGTGADAYQVIATTGGAGSVSISLSSSTTAYTETGLSANTLYARQITARNASAYTASVTVSTYTLASPPSVPSFSGVSTGSVTLSWSSGTGGAGAYLVARSTDNFSFTTMVASQSGTSYTQTGLTPGTTYYYGIATFNSAGIADFSGAQPQSAGPVAPIQTLPVAATPSAAAGVTVSTIVWNWANPSTGVSPFGVSVQASSGGAVSVALSSSTSAYVEGSLSPNIAYTRIVRVGNAWGNTDSVTMSSTTLANPPSTPGPSVITTSGITITWSAGSGGAGSYRVERASASAGVWTILIGTNSGEQTGTSYPDSGLISNTTYFYRLSAFNSVGAYNATLSASASFRTLPAAATPGATSGVSTGTITWNWANPATGADAYQVLTATPGSGAVSSALSSTTVSYPEGGLTPNTLYSRKVQASNTYGSTNSGTMSETTLATIPVGLTGLSPSSMTVTISWTAGDATRYQVETATDTGGVWSTTATILSPGTTHQAAGLNPDTKYWFRLKSVNSALAVNLTPSATALVVTRPGSPSGFAGVIQSTGGITWSWTDPSSNETQFEVRADSSDGLVAILSPNTTFFNETAGLTPNTAYTRHVHSVVASGESSASNSASQTTYASVPAGLTGLSPSSMTVSISWTAGDATRYQVETATDTGGVWSTTATILSPGTTHQSAGLNPDTKYWYRLKSVNSSVAVNPTPSTAVQVITRPGAPTGFSGVIQSTGAITWSWTDTTANETQFEVRADSSDGLVAILSPNTTFFNETVGLNPNTAYTRHVHSVVASGEGSASGSDTRTTYANIPVLPTFTLIGTSSLTATWAAGSGGAGSYKVERATETGFGVVTVAAGASAGAQTPVSFADASLVANTTYYYRVLAYNAAGNLNPTPGAYGTTRTLPAAATPAAPGVNSPTSISWNWANPGTGSDNVSVVGSPSGTLVSNVTTYAENALSPNSPYTRQARETNNTGTTDSVNMTTTTLANLPTGLTVMAVSSDVVTLSWTAPAPNGAGSYKVERSTDAGFGTLATVAGAQSGSLTATLINDVGLTPDTKYYYRAYAYNTVGAINPNPTAASIATTRATTAPALSSSTVTTASILWTWTTSQSVNHVGFVLEDAAHVVIVDTGTSTSSYLESGLVANTGYTRHVHAKVLTPVGTESPTSNDLTIYTRAGSPTALAGGAVGDGKVVLSWTAPANGAYKYRVERAPALGGTYAIMARVLGAGTTHQDVTPSPGTYAYRIVAENAQSLDSPAATNEVSVEVAGPVTVAVAPTSTATVTVVGSDTGTVKTSLEVPPGAFTVAVSVAISSTAPTSSAPAATLADAAAKSRGDTKVKVDDDLSDTVRELTARDDAGRLVQPVKGIKFTIPFNLKKVKSYMAKALKICRLNESSGEWEVAEGNNAADLTAGSVTTTITHFSLFRLAYAFAPAPALDADTVKVFPNPLDLSKGAVRGAVKFDGLTAGSVVEVYDVAGELVVRMEPGFARGGSVNSAPVNGRAEWDGHDMEGNVVVRGLYLYRVLDPGKGSVSGKFAVITK